MSDPDRTLADRAARGDRRALMELYERHRSRLFGYLTRSLGNATLAEDVFQDVWIKVMQKIGTYRPGTASFRAWLYRVASNAAVDRLRREAVRSGPELDAPVHDHGPGRVVRETKGGGAAAAPAGTELPRDRPRAGRPRRYGEDAGPPGGAPFARGVIGLGARGVER